MEEEFVALLNKETKIRQLYFKVSSVLNKDTKSYGKQYLCDGKEETCWNSDQGETQWIIVNFNKPVRIKKFEFKFQGGFCACHAQLDFVKQNDPDRKFQKLIDFYPQDINSEQVFQVDLSDGENEESDTFRFNFIKLTDFFGRLIVYNFQIYGIEINP